MKKYMLKRFLLGIVTLIGIIIITFLIIQLTPGDPASVKLAGVQSGGQKLASEIITETRRLYGLDKPILFNFSIKGRDAYVRDLLKKYLTADDEKKKKIQSKIVSIGKASFPALRAALSDRDFSSIRTNILSILIKLTGESRLPDGYTDKIESLPEWISFLDKFLEIYSRDNIEKITWTAAHALTQYDRYETEQALNTAGTLGTEVWMPLIINLKDKREWQYFTELGGRILNKPWRVEKSFSDAERNRIYTRWKDWRRDNYYLYRNITTTERLASVLTQTRFWSWFRRVLTLDFGESYSYRRSVLELVLGRLPVTLQLNLLSFFFIYLFSIPLGIFSATHQNQLSDRIVTTFIFILYSLPVFWVAEMLILFTTGDSFINFFPSHYLHSPDADKLGTLQYLKDWIWHLILPVFCLTYGGIAYISKQMRAGMLETIRQDYIRTAQSKGLSRFQVIYKHALRNALIPIVTLLGYLLPALLGGSIIIEEIFSLNGIGKLSFEAVFNRDYPVVMALAVFSAVLTLIGLFISDVLYVLIDPRISFDES